VRRKIGTVTRHLVLFAREPARQAREKGFGRLPDASLLFSTFAAGWAEAARRAGASLTISTPREDLTGWRRAPAAALCDAVWIVQEGHTFGERLHATAARAAAFPGHAVVVGGDVPPSAGQLLAAFEALESGVDAVLAPAADGGVSLIGLPAGDLDLLLSIGQRGRNVFSTLRDALAGRGRRIAVLASAPDVDGRRGLRGLLRRPFFSAELCRLGRRLLAIRPSVPLPPTTPAFEAPAASTPFLRGPPLAA
jgi:glycosyltransferase A (GT-A) superfamily protein (DUF2064 family)